MPVSLQSLGIANLGIEDRLSLIEELWNSITAESHGFALSETQRAELSRRIAEYEDNPDDTIPWDEVKASALDRHKQ